MVKTDLKRKKCMNLEETHIATWHQQTFNFSRIKLLFWIVMTKLEYHSLTALKAETQEYRRKSLFMLQMYKKVLSR